MNRLVIVSLFFASITVLVSCKKDNDSGSNVNQATAIKGSFWAGEFKYTSGDYTGLQAFSIEFKDDGTTTWSDAGSTRTSGTWKVEGSKITLTFPNGTSLSATLSKDEWINIDNPVVNGFKINNLSRSFRPEQKNFLNTLWKGRYEDDATLISVKFLDGAYIDKLEYIHNYNGRSTYILPYTIEGAGIRFTITEGNGHRYYHYLSFKNESSIKGMYYSAYQLFGGTWPLFRPLTLTKQ